MNTPSFLILIWSIFVGCMAGAVYSCSFILQHKGLFGIKTTQNTAHSIAFFIIRLGIILLVGKYLLQAPVLPSILGLIGFLSVFWLIILQIKAKSYERA